MSWIKKNLWVLVLSAGLCAALLIAVRSGGGSDETAPSGQAQLVLSAEDAFDAALAYHRTLHPDPGDEPRGRRTMPDGQSYTVSFSGGGRLFQYRVDARTGYVRDESAAQPGVMQPAAAQPAVLTDDTPRTDPPSPAGAGPEYDPEQAALRAALAHAGVDEDDVDESDVALRRYDGRPVCYEVSFRAGNAAYGYQVGLDCASVLAWERETVVTRRPENAEENAYDEAGPG